MSRKEEDVLSENKPPDIEDIIEQLQDLRIVSLFKEKVKKHPPTQDCPIQNCVICSMRDCPFREPFHYSLHEACPCCSDILQ